MSSYIFATELFDGSGAAPKLNQLIEIDRGLICSCAPATKEEAERQGAVCAPVVAPGFIDLQINGANDTLFNDDPSVQSISRIGEGARRGGTAHFLPTFITAPDKAYPQAIEAAEQALEQGVTGVLGIHLEGPFLSPDRAGIHPKSAICPLNEEDLENLTAPFAGCMLLTLAPEQHEPHQLEALVEAGLVVFAGHSEAGAEAMNTALAAGLSGVTHLYNAMSQMSGREPGVVGSALSSTALYAGIIADGIHVHPANVALAARLKPDHLCLVSDAMPTLAGTCKQFNLYGTKIYLKGNKLSNGEGVLAGAHLAMDQALRNMLAFSNCTPAQALKMASTNPAHALGLEEELGYIKKGYRASMTLLDEDMQVRGVMVDGTFYE
ncbi:N-acetylglucosamine-6-phosphate deacetylase [Flexibacterium corallicola]|uniref:N-acetylglucosamine-6-phosphate deacetylase n=1 Tax=Flexibacterium corallicola TaxID=3037259 RepID=UPI00286FA23F|nr:N-acetylglucosamine-6-phosphate deacetylase [Pseudovibrio sp. M1P-2-3]